MTENSSEKDQQLSFKERILRDLEMARAGQASQPMAESSQPPKEETSFVAKEKEIRPQDLQEKKQVEEELPPSDSVDSKDKLKLNVSYQTDSSEAKFGTLTAKTKPVTFVEPKFKPQPKPRAQTKIENPNLLESAVLEEPVIDTPVASDSIPRKSQVKEEPSTAALSRAERNAHFSKKEKKAKQKHRIVGRVVLFVTIFLLLAIGVAGFFGYRYVTAALGPVDAKDTKFVTVEIPEGSGTKYIASLLKDAGVIKDAHVFNYYSKFKNYGNFQSGYYNLQKSMDLDTIAQKLQEGGTEIPQAPVVGKIVIPEGYTIDQIAQAVTVNADSKKKEKTPFTAETFLKAVQDDAFIEQEVAKYPKLLASLPAKGSGVKYRLEGYLFPATYTYGESTTAEELIDQMLAAMDKNLANYYDVLASKNLTVNEMLTMASLVEKEGSTDADRKDIASVFYNRLNQGMQLQSNIAILYAQGKLGQKTTLAEDAGIDTNIDSPYNIYKNTGLMPGAVDNPGLSAIEAAVNPNKTDYLYFVANVETGQVYFAQTFEEHNKNVEEHVNSKLTQASQ